MPIVDLPLDQRNIIITRSKEGILDIKKIFTTKGANVFDLPAISIGDPDDLNPLDEALNQIHDFHWIIFSSKKAAFTTVFPLEKIIASTFRLEIISIVSSGIESDI